MSTKASVASPKRSEKFNSCFRKKEVKCATKVITDIVSIQRKAKAHFLYRKTKQNGENCVLKVLLLAAIFSHHEKVNKQLRGPWCEGSKPKNFPVVTHYVDTYKGQEPQHLDQVLSRTSEPLTKSFSLDETWGQGLSKVVTNVANQSLSLSESSVTHNAATNVATEVTILMGPLPISARQFRK